MPARPESVAADASPGGGRPADGLPASIAWAKTDGHGEPALSLVDHSVDVAAVAEALLTSEVVKRRLSGLAGRPLTETDVGRLSFFAGLHDVGKAVRAFQARLRGGPPASHTGPVWRVLGSESAWTEVRGMLWKSLGRDRWRHWFASRDEEASHWDAVLAHHGSLPTGAGTAHPGQWKSARNGYDPLDAVAEVRETLAAMFVAAIDSEAESLPAGPRFLHAWVGWVALADWLGSDPTVFGFPKDGAPSGIERIRWSRDRAACLARRRFFDLLPTRETARALDMDFRVLFPAHTAPRPAQDALLGQARSTDGRIVALESETGSGKTEAALIHFLRLFRDGEVDGLYFALPTRAAAKQIHARVRGALRRWLGEEAPPVVLAVPGYLRVDDYEGQRLPDSHVLARLPRHRPVSPAGAGMDRRCRSSAASDSTASPHPRRRGTMTDPQWVLAYATIALACFTLVLVGVAWLQLRAIRKTVERRGMVIHDKVLTAAEFAKLRATGKLVEGTVYLTSG